MPMRDMPVSRISAFGVRRVEKRLKVLKRVNFIQRSSRREKKSI